ncbi:hypothetical protein [Nostoc sp.]|uniref:hypothetical protein n=1 Tax=Nostoc sp. TaxID=1180 RepID=UPI002FF79868
MHFSALVIMPLDTDNIETKVKELLSSYNENIEVEPYREYLNYGKLANEIKHLETFPLDKIEKMAADWEVCSNDLETLAKIELEWFEDEVDGIDEKGEYKVLTYNPQGKWDWYRFIEFEPIESGTPILYPCRVADLPQVVPYAIVTPNSEWYELGEDAGIKAFANTLKGNQIVSDEEAEWQLKVQEILAHYSDHLCVALMCHR